MNEFWVVYWGIIGAVIGSFLGVVIERLPQGKSIVYGRSHCDHCKKPLRWFELIPILSFLWQGAKCRRCRKSLSWRYPILEGIMSIIGALLFFFYGASPLAFVGAFMIASSLVALVVIDLDHMIIPDSTLLVSGLGGLMLFMGTMGWKALLPSLMTNMLVGLMASGIFYLLYIGTKKQGMGFGDVKLAFIIGFLTGFPRVVLSLYLAFLTGGLVGIILMIQGKKKLKSPVPFGPFLILGLVLSLIIPLAKITQFFSW